MLKSLTIPTCLAMGLAIGVTQSSAQVVREGMRRTGNAVVQGGRAVAQGTRNAINRTGQATRNVVDNTANATRNTVNGVQGSEPSVSANANADAGLNSGISQQPNGAMQPPLPADASAMGPQGQYQQGQYQSGYRGLNNPSTPPGQANYQGRVYRLRHDRQGREFICVNGHAVYFDDQQGGPQQREAYKLNSDPMANGQQMNDRQGSGQAGYNSPQYQGEYGPQYAPPAPPAPIRSDLNSAAPASPSLNADTGISAEQRTQLNDSANVDANGNVGASAESNDHSADSSSDASASSDLDHDNRADSESADADADSANDSHEHSEDQSSE